MPASLGQQALSVSDHLASAVPASEGICLYGSVARGDADEDSDIHLLVLGDDRALPPSALTPDNARGVAGAAG